MEGIIWYKTRQKGLIRLDKLINDYAKINIGILSIRNHMSEIYVRFLNDDIWRVVSATCNSRGKASNIALIDIDIEQDIIDKIIMPTLKMQPYRAYNFYNYNLELEESDKNGIYG